MIVRVKVKIQVRMKVKVQVRVRAQIQVKVRRRMLRTGVVFILFQRFCNWFLTARSSK